MSPEPTMADSLITFTLVMAVGYALHLAGA